MGGKKQVSHLDDFRSYLPDLGDDKLGVIVAEGHGNPARTNQSPAEAVSRKNNEEVQKLTADPSVISGRRIEGHVAAQGAKVADMAGQAFQLKGSGAQGPSRYIRIVTQGQGFHCLGIGDAVGHGCIPGNSFDHYRQAFERERRQELFNAAVLVAQLNFEMQDLFADALETEVAGLDDAGMDGTDTDLVDLFSLDPEIFIVAGDIFAVIIAENIFSMAFVGMEPNRFKPGMVDRPSAVLFRDFPLKQMKFFIFCRKGGKFFRKVAGNGI